jgi:uncharacterized membrane protein YgdD (TMEM256/DUF423 family)
MTPDRLFFTLGALSAAIGVGAGAFGAHFLKLRLPPNLLEAYEVGVRYQVFHALALLATGLASSRWPGGAVTTAGWLFVIGTALFSGSLYLLALSGQRWLGAVTPLGGLAFLGGWLSLAWSALRG